MWFCICIVFVREGKPRCGEIVSRWDQWSACGSVNAVVHSHFCTSEEMQQLILPQWARASQRCKCGHSSMEPLTSVGKSEIIEQPALSFLLKEREICIGSFIYFFFFFFFSGKNTHGAFFIILLVGAKEELIRHITESDRFSLNFHAGISDMIISCTPKSGDFTVRSNRSSYSQQKMFRFQSVTLVYRCAHKVETHFTSRQTAKVPGSMFERLREMWKMYSRKILCDKQYNDTLLFDCIAVLPPCRCVLLSTAITSGTTVCRHIWLVYVLLLAW